MNTETTKNNSFVPAHLAIEAMRDNGYRNTAYAVAELIDNSIQAGASNVELLCAEEEVQMKTRTGKRLKEIAILDNGSGMDSDVLAKALQFGNGTRLKKSERTGMGRFGMGLPASSISQGKRVDVWSWQNGIENAQAVTLDIDDVRKHKVGDMPSPVNKPIPEEWLEAGSVFADSGTLVVWSKLDRLMWTRGETLVSHSELLIGRMYRKFIYDNSVKINLKVFEYYNPSMSSFEKYTLPNDPLYLMENTSCSEPFNEDAMFLPYGGIENYEKKFTIEADGEEHEMTIRLSLAKDEARTGNAGNKPHGKHAASNVGISIVRAGRELELDNTLVLKYDPTERWWGVEVDFPPSLDELMGVTNNKQTARNFSDILSIIEDIEKMQKNNKSIREIQAEYEEEGDPRAPLIVVCDFINKKIKQMRKYVNMQNKGTRKKRYEDPDNGPEKKATDFTNKRKDNGYSGASDADEINPPDRREQDIEEGLTSQGLDESTAKEVAQFTVKHNLKYSFTEFPFESDAFFTVRPCGGAINIAINKEHPAYSNLVEVLLDNGDETESVEKLRERLAKASTGLKLLLAAWARHEDEAPDGQRKDMIQAIRREWGIVAKNFMREREG
ncbi:ATP-binding protein [Halobacillus yeomjeoni]|uniref:ATP-binding protein n=1 Tax=Halobacillus yeomjeoni TaxID=311194 RepID=UPI001CD4ABCD|nr:ATP-binding protein [Halobacillus yeomjeoni]MCA0982563.1 ATP-binding protein [Halobacillus yeomjeoni]